MSICAVTAAICVFPIIGCGGGGAGSATSNVFSSSTGTSAATGTVAQVTSVVSGTSVETRTISFGASGARGYIPVTAQIGAGGTPFYVAPDSTGTASFPDTASAPILLTAPSSYADRQFVKWQWAGQDISTASTLSTTSAQLTGTGPLLAIYQPLAAPAAGFTPNFTRSGFPHWSQFPVTVYLDGTIASGSTKEASIVNGLNRWVSASGGVVSYQIVTDPSQADISIGFGSTPTGLVALTTASWDGNMNLINASVALNPPVLGVNEVSTQNLDTIMAHEFGHALGLISDTDLTAGHSSDAHDTMYPTGNSTIGLISARDMNTIATNYLGSFTGDASGRSMSALHGSARRAAVVGTLHKASIN